MKTTKRTSVLYRVQSRSEKMSQQNVELCTMSIGCDEKERKEMPTKDQIKYSVNLLSQYGIRIEIPEFKTYADLERWRTKQIKKYLSLFTAFDKLRPKQKQF